MSDHITRPQSRYMNKVLTDWLKRRERPTTLEEWAIRGPEYIAAQCDVLQADCERLQATMEGVLR